MKNIKAQAMMIEFLIAGVMMLFALIVLSLSIFPKEAMNLAYWIRFQYKWMSSPPFVIMVFVSVSYGFGIFYRGNGSAHFRTVDEVHSKQKNGITHRFCSENEKDIFLLKKNQSILTRPKISLSREKIWKC